MGKEYLDVFISYQHESKLFADAICTALERNKIKCFYAPRDTDGGTYADQLVEAIESCKVLVLILDNKSSESSHVMAEVREAFEMNKTIIPFKISSEISRGMYYYIGNSHWIDAMNGDLTLAIDELVEKVGKATGKNITKQMGASGVVERGRVSNNYLKFTPDKNAEWERGRAQAEVVLHFTHRIYDDFLRGKNNVTVLDVCSGNGYQVHTALGNRPEVKKIIGLDCNSLAVEAANRDYCSENMKFYELDCEDFNLNTKLKEIMVDNMIEKFDIVNLSFSLLQIANPLKLLIALRKVTAPGGKFMIIDVDDKLLQFYPDEEGIFRKAMSILEKVPSSGYRFGGKEINFLLVSAGISAEKIRLEYNGISTVGNYDIIEDMAETYFGLIPIVLSEFAGQGNDIRADAEWFEESRDKLYNLIHKPGSMMIAGIVVYTATV